MKRSTAATFAQAFLPMLVLVGLTVSYLGIETQSAHVPSVTDFADRPASVGTPAALLTEHDCWTGEAPANMVGKMPGHVVVAHRDAVAPVYGGSRLVGQALDQVFDGEDHGLVVYGFCS